MNKTKSTVQAQCPTCKKRMPHETVGIGKADDGRRCQAMTCKVCATTTTVYEDPDGFQVNFDWPDGSAG